MSSTKHALQYFPYNRNSQECWVHIQRQTFSVASTHLYKRVHPSVSPSVRPSVLPSNVFLYIAEIGQTCSENTMQLTQLNLFVHSFIQKHHCSAQTCFRLARRVAMTARQPDSQKCIVLMSLLFHSLLIGVQGRQMDQMKVVKNTLLDPAIIEVG